MAIKHTAITYYGLNYVEHAIADFKEMKEHGCDTVILAITEFDMDFWFPNINEIVKAGHSLGLRVIADPWGIGKFFGGEQVSLFLQNNIHNRQISALTGEPINAACINTVSFREYFMNFCVKLARETEVDGFFWDEPHWAMPSGPSYFQNCGCEDWTCRCPNCMKKFEAEYGYEMPKRINDDVRMFRRKAALSILSDTSKKLKEINPKLEITCCVLATLEEYYIKEDRGYDDWDMVASCPYFDVFATTIIDWESSDVFVRDIAERTVKYAKKYGKESERWLHCYYSTFTNYDRIDEVVSFYEELGVDRLAAWTYRGGYGTRLAAKNPLALWDAIGRNYNRVMNKNKENK